MGKLIPQTLLSDIPDLYATEGVLDPLCYVKLLQATLLGILLSSLKLMRILAMGMFKGMKMS